MKQKILSLMACAALLIAACATNDGGAVNQNANTLINAPRPQGRCDVGGQSEELDRIIQRAARGDVDAGVTARADDIAHLAEQAGAGAVGKPASQEITCRFTSLRAYNALMNVPGRETGALAGLHQQAIDGHVTCDGVLRDSTDAGDRMACGYVNQWFATLASIEATQTIQSIGASLPSPTTQEVGDDDWRRIGDQVALVRANIESDWAALSGPAEADHKTRVACRFYFQMTDETMRWRAALNSQAKFHAVTEPFEPIMAAAARAIPVQIAGEVCTNDAQACQAARVHAMDQVCAALRSGG